MARGVLLLAAAFVIAVLVWQGITAKGSPDPMEAPGSKAVAIFDVGVLVFEKS
jgi:high-affinity iron transporter